MIAGSATARSHSALDREGGSALVVGGGLAAVVLALPLLRFVLSYLGILVHEAGHAAASWLFGYPALPAFDFTYGGGVTLSGGRRWLLVAVVVALAGWAIWRLQPARRAQALVGALLGAYLLAAVTPLHEMLILAMGHGGELLFAGLALYRTATGSGCKWPQAERPLYAMVGWFLLARAAGFAWGLLTDPGRRQLYADAKGGGHWMDFSRLARDYLGSGVELPAALLLAACLATPAVVWWLLRRRAAAAV